MSSANSTNDWEDELLPEFELVEGKSAEYDELLHDSDGFNPEYWKHLCKFVVGGVQNLPDGHERGNFEPLYTRILVEVEKRTVRIFRRDLKSDADKEQLINWLQEKYGNDEQFRNMVDNKSQEYGDCGHDISGRRGEADEKSGKDFEDVFMVDGEFSIKRYRGALKAALKDRSSVRGPELLNTDKSMKSHLRKLEETLQHKLKHCYKCRVNEHTDGAEKLKQYKWLFANDDEFRELLEEKHKPVSGVGNGDNDRDSPESGENGGDSNSDNTDAAQSGVRGSRYGELAQIGVVTDNLNVNWKKFRGLALAYVKDVDEIRGPEEYFDIDVVVEGFYKWGLWKFEDGWIRFLEDKVDAEEFKNQVQRIYTSNDDFNQLAHSKYQHDPNELSGNLGPGDLASASVLVDEGLLLTNSAFDEEAEEDDTEHTDTHETEEVDGSGVEDSDALDDDSGSVDDISDDESVGYECNGCDMVFEDSVELVDHLSDNPTHRKDYDGDGNDGDSDGGSDGGSQAGSNGSLSDFGSGGSTDTDTNDSHGPTRGTLDAYSSESSGNGGSNGDGVSVDSTSPGPEDLDTDSGDNSNSDGDSGGDIDSGRVENLRQFIDIYGSEDDKKRVRRPKVVNQVIHGNAGKVPQFMARGYVDCVVTSPPYWQLRDYEGGVEDDWGDGTWEGQLGHEPTPDMFVEHLADVFDGVREVMKPEGSLWVNLADTYSGKSGGHYSDDDYDGGSMGHDGNRPGLGVDGVLPQKCLAGVPQRFMLEMIDRGWILRNKIIWAKQVVFEDNDAKGTTMPTAAKDRVIEKAAEPIYHFVKQKDYHYDLDPIRRPHKTQPGEGSHYGEDAKMTKTENHGDADVDLSRNFDEKEFYSEGGANLPRVWHVNLQQSSDEHYAAYPETLVKRPVKATCPEGGVVMDPFTGTGTTLRVASDMGRNWVGIEFSDKYIEIARNNITKGIQQTIV